MVALEANSSSELVAHGMSAFCTMMGGSMKTNSASLHVLRIAPSWKNTISHDSAQVGCPGSMLCTYLLGVDVRVLGKAAEGEDADCHCGWEVWWLLRMQDCSAMRRCSCQQRYLGRTRLFPTGADVPHIHPRIILGTQHRQPTSKQPRINPSTFTSSSSSFNHSLSDNNNATPSMGEERDTKRYPYLASLNDAQLRGGYSTWQLDSGIKLTTTSSPAVTSPPDVPLQILAGPGSGKTRVLTSRVAHLVKCHKYKPYEVTAVTFTNKAANEMRKRLQVLLGDKEAAQLVLGESTMCVRV